MTLANCKKVSPEPLLVIATTCLGVGVVVVPAGMYVGASTSTAPLSIPKQASVPPMEPPLPRMTATVPLANLTARTSSKLVAAKLVEPTNPAQRTPQVQKGREDPFAPLYSDEQTGQVNPAPQPLPPKPAPPQLELSPPPAAEVRQAAQYASRIILKGASEAEDGRSALVQLPGEPSPRFVDEGEIVKVGQGKVRFARIEDVDSSSPRIVLEENGVEVVRALGQKPTKRNSSESPTIAINSSPQLRLHEPVTEAESPDSAIVPVPSLPPVGKSHRGGDRLPSPPPLSDANETVRQKENNQLPALKPAKLGQRMVNQAIVADRSLQPAGVVTPARQERAKLLSQLRQPRPPRPVSIQERQRHLQQHPPFLLPVTNHSTSLTTRARLQAEAGDKLLQFQDRRHLERRQLVRRLRQSSLQQPAPPSRSGERASSNWEKWQKIATFVDRTEPSSSP